MRKAFEKQIRTIEDQGERQIKAIQDQGQVKTIKNYTYDDEDTPLILKQKEILNKLVDERLEEITNLDKKVNSDDLIYRYKGNTADEKFHKFDNVFSLLDKIRTGKISLAEAKNDQVKFKFNLGEIRRRNSKKISKEQKKETLCTILKCFTKQETRLSNFWMIILRWYLKQNLKQLKEQDLEYQHLNKFFKDCK